PLMVDGLDIVIITGLSGSGKSVAIHGLEANGLICIDNLPALLIQKFIDLCQWYQERINRIALGVALRRGHCLHSWPHGFAAMRVDGPDVQVVFCDASDEVLLRRINETRRPHPRAGKGSIQEGITRERKAVEGMRDLADKVIDTSDLNVPQLKRE